MVLFYLGSIAIRINDNEFVLKDNSNGEIFNDDHILSSRGSVNYTSGIIDIEFVSNDTVTKDIIVDYTKNKANIALYKNLNTEKFSFDASALMSSDTGFQYFN